MNWRRPLKWTLLFLAILLVLLISVILIFYYTLKSGEWTQSAIPRVQPYLTPLGITLNRLESAQIDLLRSIKINNVAVEYSDPELGEVKLTAAKLVLSYSLSSLISKKIVVDEITLQNLHIDARIQVQPPSGTVAASEPMDLEQLSELLRVPAFPVNAKNINLDNLSFNIKLNQPQGWQHIAMQLKHFNSDVDWQENNLKGRLNLQMEQTEDKPWIISEGNETKSVEIKLDPKIKTDLDWELVFSNNQWQLKNTDVKHVTSLDNIKILETVNDTTQQLGSVGLLDFSITTNLRSSNTSASSHGLESIFPLQISTQLKSVVHKLEFKQLRRQQLMLDGQAEHRLSASIEGSFHPFEKPLPDLSFSVEQHLSIPNFTTETGAQSVGFDNFKWDLNAHGKTQASAPLKLEFTLNNSADAVEFEQQQDNDLPNIKVSLKPQIDLNVKGQLQSFSNALQGLIFDFVPSVLLKNIQIQVGTGKDLQKYSMAQQRLAVNGNFNKGQFNLNSEIESSKVRIPQIAQVFSLKNKIGINSDIQFSKSDLTLNSKLDGIALLDVNLKSVNQNDYFDLEHHVILNAPLKLKKYHSAAAVLDQIGFITLQLDGQSQIQHGTKTLLEADFSKLADWPTKSSGSIQLAQPVKPKTKNALLVSSPIALDYRMSKQKDYNIKLNIKAPGIQVAPLRQPINLALRQTGQFDWPLKSANATTQIDIDNSKTLDMSVSVLDQDQTFKLKTKIVFNSSAAWQSYLEDLKQLEHIGDLATHIDIDSIVKHGSSSVLDIDLTKPEQLIAQTHLRSTIKQTRSYADTKVKMEKPLQLDQQLNWSKKGIDWKASFSLQQARLPEILSIDTFSGNLTLNASPGLDPKNAKLAVHLDQGYFQLLPPNTEDVDLQKKPLELGPLTTPLDLAVSGGINKDHVKLDKFDFSGGAKLVTIQAQGNSDTQVKNANLDTTISINMRPDILTAPQLSGSGSIEIPLNLTFVNGEHITLEGETRFNNFNLDMIPIVINEINGGIKIEEELLWKDERIRFRYFEHSNAFQRVDFNRIQPYLTDQQTLKLTQLKLDHVNVGPGNVGILLKQNMVRLQKFDLDLLDGHVTGQFYLDVLPGAWKIGLLSRISHIDLRLLQKDPAAQKKGKLSPISARTAIEFDINKRLMEGDIDINEISSEQLNQLLNVFDPDHSDEQIAKIRLGLHLAYPKKVSLVMKKGYINIEVLTSISEKPFTTGDQDLTSIIQQFGGETFELLKLLPLD